MTPNTEWRYGWAWIQETDYNQFRKGPDGQPGRAVVDDDGDGTADNHRTSADYQTELGWGDDLLLAVLNYPEWGNALGALPATPWFVGYAIEQDAYLQMTNGKEDLWESDWGNPGKQHHTNKKYDD